MTLDLHVHSVFSDGVLTPEALCALAVRKQVHTLALCDHDTTAGLAPMAAAVAQSKQAGHDLLMIPSVELSSGSDGRTHVLGYGVNVQNEAFQDTSATMRRQRESRGAQMLDALKGIGITVPPEWLPNTADGQTPIGRPHVARALIRLGVVNTMDQAFERYLAQGKPAYVPYTHLQTTQAIALLRAAGAVPVLAHPIRLGMPPQILEALICALQAQGLQGLEVFHPSASRGDVRALENLAHRLGLLVTGGSDFHGDRGTRTKLGGLPSGWRTWQADLLALQTSIQAVPLG